MSWGNPSNSIEKLGQVALCPLAAFYQVGAMVASLGYHIGLLKQLRLSVPVVSIGNITVGGTGKTPIVIDMAKRYSEQGYRVGILSRGYKRKSNAEFVVVSDGTGKIANPEASGDEPNLIAHAVPEAVVIVGSKRVLTGLMAVEKFGCDVVLLDDGFQHRALYRDQDIVLIDYADDPENDALLPAGRLRENLSSLTRAKYVVITKVPKTLNQEKLTSLKQAISRHAPQAQILSCRFVSRGFTPIGDASPNDLNGKKAVAFCAIARPKSFYDSLIELGVQVAAIRDFPDHHWFTEADMQQIAEVMKSSSASVLVTTAKDAVRISPQLSKAMPIYVLNQGTEWLEGAPPVEPLQVANR